MKSGFHKCDISDRRTHYHLTDEDVEWLFEEKKRFASENVRLRMENGRLKNKLDTKTTYYNNLKKSVAALCILIGSAMFILGALIVHMFS